VFQGSRSRKCGSAQTLSGSCLQVQLF
jgi:hypothetical protein